MSILSGFFKTKKYRKTDSGYKLQSEWTSSQTVQMDDGNTLEKNLGAIKGITSSLSSTSSNYALSASAGKSLNDSIKANTSSISTLNTNLDKKAPTSHASSGTGYGAGNASNYGHVKLSDNYDSSAGNASSSVGASSYAVARSHQVLASAISNKVVVEDLSCTGLGQPWIYIPVRSGYKLANVYNGDRKFNVAKVTAFEYDGNNNIYDVYLDISQPTTNHILLRCIWVQG